jgi:hypothetical protein
LALEALCNITSAETQGQQGITPHYLYFIKND